MLLIKYLELEMNVIQSQLMMATGCRFGAGNMHIQKFSMQPNTATGPMLNFWMPCLACSVIS